MFGSHINSSLNQEEPLGFLVFTFFNYKVRELS